MIHIVLSHSVYKAPNSKHMSFLFSTPNHQLKLETKHNTLEIDRKFYIWSKQLCTTNSNLYSIFIFE